MPGAYSSPYKVSILKALKEEGFSDRHIARRIQKDRTVDRIVKRLEEEGECERRPKSGRPKKTTNRGERRIKHHILEDRRCTSGEIQALVAKEVIAVSRRTIRRRPRKKSLLMKKMKEARLQWAKDHLH